MVDSIKRFFLLANILVAAIFAAWIIYSNWYDIVPIHVIHSTSVINPIVKEGTKVFITVSITRRAICNPKIIRVTTNVDSGVIVKITTSPAAVGGLGKNITTTFSVPDTDTLPPGRYTGTGYVVNDCGGRIYTTPTIPYSWRVVPK